MSILLGLVIAIAGAVIVWKNEAMLNILGRNEWAEEKFGPEGGSRALYKIIGVMIVLVGLFIMMGLGSSVIEALLPYFGANL